MQIKRYLRSIAIVASLLVALALGITSVQIMMAGVGTPNLENSEITVNPTQALAGTTVNYTVVISNSGDGAANNVLVTNTLPIEASFVPGSLISNTSGATTVDYGVAGGIITWTGSVDGLGSVSLSYNATLSEALPVGDIVTSDLQITGTASLIERTTSTTIVESLYTYLPLIFKAVPAPELNPVSDSTGTTWIVSWTSPAPNVTGYQVQEANGTDFGSAVQVDAGNNLSRSFTNAASPQNQYCYRVRATVGLQLSNWSNVRCIIGNYADEFGGNSTEWSIRRQDTDDVENSSYLSSGQFVIKIKGRWDYAIASPLKQAPELPYRIETRVRFDDGVDNLHAYGIVFGGDWNGNTCPAGDYSTCFNRYYRLLVIYYGAPNGYRIQLKRIDFHSASTNSGGGVELIPFKDIYVGDPAGFNTWRIDVAANGRIELYLNNVRVGDVVDTNYINSPYFGVMATTDEYLGAEPHFDWVRVSQLP